MRMSRLTLRFSLLSLLLWFTPASSFGQPKGFQEVKDPKQFQQNLTRAHAAVNTISADFTQVKNMALLADKIRSKGKFYFKKEDKVRIEYTSPYTYLLVMNGGQIMVRDEQKTSRVNTKNSRTMQSVNRIMIDCMRGTVLQNPDFKTLVLESSNSYLLTLVPANESMKKLFRSIDVYLSKKTFDVDRLTMTEQGGDFTEMAFTNTRHNPALNEGIFKTR